MSSPFCLILDRILFFVHSMFFFPCVMFLLNLLFNLNLNIIPNHSSIQPKWEVCHNCFVWYLHPPDAPSGASCVWRCHHSEPPGGTPAVSCAFLFGAHPEPQRLYTHPWNIFRFCTFSLTQTPRFTAILPRSPASHRPCNATPGPADRHVPRRGRAGRHLHRAGIPALQVCGRCPWHCHAVTNQIQCSAPIPRPHSSLAGTRMRSP